MNRDEKIDLSSLDPSFQAERWESRIREIVEQARLLHRQRERGEQLDLLDVFSNERVFDQKVQEVVSAVHGDELVRAVHGDDASPGSRSLGLQKQVTKAAPRALAIGAILAAATWLGVLWLDPPRVRPTVALESPGLNLAVWAEQGRVPRTEDILIVIEVAHVR